MVLFSSFSTTTLYYFSQIRNVFLLILEVFVVIILVKIILDFHMIQQQVDVIGLLSTKFQLLTLFFLFFLFVEKVFFVATVSKVKHLAYFVDVCLSSVAIVKVLKQNLLSLSRPVSD
jgi:hypothetical protein